MAKIQPIYYRNRRGSQPVKDFIEKQEVTDQVALNNQILRIEALCTPEKPDLPFPYSSSVDGPLRELRFRVGSILYRILYRRSGNLLILLHIVKKKSPKLLDTDIQTAKDRWDDFKRRMDADPRVPPRAAGQDAP